MKAIGIDTSNYTTSAALYNDETDELIQYKKLLPVQEGALGLRQSDALFHQVRQLPGVMEGLRAAADGHIDCVGASNRPQQVEGSYMPCFMAGYGAAQEIGACMNIPVYVFTHQQGHVAAALYSAKRLDLISERFLAFHVSGGTTDALLVEPDEEEIIRCRVVAKSLDLKAGQLIDRVGVMLGMPFPAGPHMESCAAKAEGSYRPHASMEGANCHLSGVQNQCEAMYKKGAPAQEVALFCLKSIEAALIGMTEALLREYGKLPIVYAGGVMSNSMLQQTMSSRFGGHFAKPAFSSDNAAGIAVLTAISHNKCMR